LYCLFLENLSDINNKIDKSRNTLQHITDKVKCEQQILQKENDRLESISNECNSLRITEIELEDVINKTKMQLNQVYKGNLIYYLGIYWKMYIIIVVNKSLETLIILIMNIVKSNNIHYIKPFFKL